MLNQSKSIEAIEESGKRAGVLTDDGFFQQEDWQFSADLMAGESPELIIARIEAAAGESGKPTIELIREFMTPTPGLHLIPVKK